MANPENAAALNGPQKAAIVLLALGKNLAATIFKQLERDEITAISKAMVEMDTISKEMAQEVLKEFNETMLIQKDMLIAGPSQVKKLLTENLDPDTAKYVLDSLDLNLGRTPFKELNNVSPKILSQILRNEHPQTMALIAGHLPPDNAAELLQHLSPGARAEVMMRLAKLEAVPEDMLLEVDRVLQNQLIAIGGKEGKHVGGVQAVAEILNAIDHSTEEEILTEIEEDSASLADEIRQLMFVFEDATSLDNRAIREVLKEISNEELGLAMKTASDELKTKFFSNMSERAATMIQEDLEIMGPVKLSEVESAQQSIVKTIRRLEAEGRIAIPGKGGGEVLV
ncbi:flagellar motor switch protein FliG [Desulfoplanes formicivorans]|uniref:Flagellar motor switch protein FliG n=1 Tax=Desulfoplanes formicivorans TaxID=1592317 RepID=A0A194AHU6_9BACT|nr:flagellar motor switch protein FliG [Desulfoplanes formicivorans]GAU08795.1 flagellar motor switch protein FliG [Desulfoplanes formicivorans]